MSTRCHGNRSTEQNSRFISLTDGNRGYSSQESCDIDRESSPELPVCRRKFSAPILPPVPYQRGKKTAFPVMIDGAIKEWQHVTNVPSSRWACAVVVTERMALILVSTPASSRLCWLWMHQPWNVHCSSHEWSVWGAKNHVARVHAHMYWNRKINRNTDTRKLNQKYHNQLER